MPKGKRSTAPVVTLVAQSGCWTTEDVDVDEEGQRSEAKKRRVGVRSIIEHIDKMIEDANQINFGSQCGGEHALEVCPEMNDNMAANALNRMRTVMEEQSKSPSSDKSRTAQITRGRKDKLPKKSVMLQGKRWNRTRLTEKEEVSKSFYNQPAYMFEIGDREEGGALLVNGIEVNKKGQGVQTPDQLDLLIERAAQESPLTIPSIRELEWQEPKPHRRGIAQ